MDSKFKIGDAVGVTAIYGSARDYVKNQDVKKFYVVNIHPADTHAEWLYKIVPDKADGTWDSFYAFESEICHYSKLYEIIHC